MACDECSFTSSLSMPVRSREQAKSLSELRSYMVPPLRIFLLEQVPSWAAALAVDPARRLDEMLSSPARQGAGRRTQPGASHEETWPDCGIDLYPTQGIGQRFVSYKRDSHTCSISPTGLWASRA